MSETDYEQQAAQAVREEWSIGDDDLAAEFAAARARIKTRGYDPARVQPVRFLWDLWLPIGRGSTLVGAGEAGKGAVGAWLTAQVTNGLLPGAHKGEPRRVLVIGDEDGFDDTWIPRVSAHGGDIERVRTLTDGEEITDLHAERAAVAEELRVGGYGLVIFDQLLDNIAAGRDDAGIYNPKSVRRVMRTHGWIARESGVAALALLHPIKGRQQSFRDLVGGSHQFTDGSRSALYLTKDPADPDGQRRVLVRAKANYAGPVASRSFTIIGTTHELHGQRFSLPVATDWQEDGRTVDDLLTAQPAPVRRGVRMEALEALTDEWQSTAAIGRALGRPRNDSTLTQALEELWREGLAERDPPDPGGRLRGTTPGVAVDHGGRRAEARSEYSLMILELR